MKNYSELSNPELDRLSAEMIIEIMIKFSNGTFAIKTPPDERHIIWRPTDKDSNQAERYLFPKLLKHATFIAEYDTTYSVEWATGDSCSERLSYVMGKFEDANRLKVIAVLEAWEALEK